MKVYMNKLEVCRFLFCSEICLNLALIFAKNDHFMVNFEFYQFESMITDIINQKNIFFLFNQLILMKKNIFD